MLFELPTELLRVILEHISLKDIARLQLAASNRPHQTILTKTLDNLCIDGEVRNISPYFQWLRMYHLRLTRVVITEHNLSPSVISYLEEQGQHITELMITVGYGSRILDNLAAIIPFIPNVTTLEIDSDSFIPEDIYQLIQSLPIRKIAIDAIRDVINVKLLLAQFPHVEIVELRCDVSFDGMGESVYPAVKRFEFGNSLDDIACLHHFPKLQQLSACNCGITLSNAELLSVCCPQLVSIELSDGESGLEGLFHILQSYPSLSSLTVSSVNVEVFQSSKLQIRCVNLIDVTISSPLLPFIVSCCPNVRHLMIDNLTVVAVTELQQLKQLRTLTVNYFHCSFDLLFHLLSHPHDQLAVIRISDIMFRRDITARDFDIPADLPIIPKLHTIHGLHHLSPATCAVLRQCPALTKVTLSDTTNDIDIELLYAACPHLKSITHNGGNNGYKLLQSSHEKLESISIFYYRSTVLTPASNHSSFPSLRTLEVDGDISIDWWNHLLMAASFNVERLTVRYSRIFDDIRVCDSLLSHSNFSGLKYVFCDELDYTGMQQLSQRSGGRIQFHHWKWLE